MFSRFFEGFAPGCDCGRGIFFGFIEVRGGIVRVVRSSRVVFGRVLCDFRMIFADLSFGRIVGFG